MILNKYLEAVKKRKAAYPKASLEQAVGFKKKAALLSAAS
uniref:Uncharacterized protein n=1 Tax=uncultured Aminicenantes bacterium TaxID=174294 RepID=Q2Z007_9BACT|nr:hypothetical protein [uncultured Aminicenantes bacterium]